MKLFILMSFSLLSAISFAGVSDSPDKFDETHPHYQQLKQVNIEAGGKAVLEQVAKKTPMTDAFLTYHCEVKDKTNCKLVQFSSVNDESSKRRQLKKTR